MRVAEKQTAAAAAAATPAPQSEKPKAVGGGLASVTAAAVAAAKLMEPSILQPQRNVSPIPSSESPGEAEHDSQWVSTTINFDESRDALEEAARSDALRAQQHVPPPRAPSAADAALGVARPA